VSPRAATTAIFAVNGAAVGTWIAQIPAAQHRLDISKSVIGLALLCMACGALLAMPLTGQILARRPSARVTHILVLIECVLIPLPLLAPSPWLLGASLLVFGAANGAMDVAMNAHGIAVEREYGRSIMSSLHGGWSVGGLAAAGAAALGGLAGLDPRVEAAIAAAVLFLLSAAVSPRLGDATAAEAGPAPKLSRPPRGVVLLGVLCLAIMVTEGAMGDWSGLYLRDDAGAEASVASVGFAGFSAGMAGGRFFGDRLANRLGTALLLRAGALLVMIALGGLLLAGDAIVAVIGFTLVGLGVSNAVPQLFSAAGRVPDTASAPALAAVFTMGYMGFIAGPPIIGLLADLISLPAALAVLLLAPAAVFVLGGRATHAARPLQAAA
jgi:predicted MFS family arabinose efflux permease